MTRPNLGYSNYFWIRHDQKKYEEQRTRTTPHVSDANLKDETPDEKDETSFKPEGKDETPLTGALLPDENPKSPEKSQDSWGTPQNPTTEIKRMFDTPPEKTPEKPPESVFPLAWTKNVRNP